MILSTPAASYNTRLFILTRYLQTRLQNMKPDASGAMPYRGVVDCAANILKHEGAGKFYTGFLAYYGRTAPHAMIILVSMEYLNTAYKKAFNT